MKFLRGVWELVEIREVNLEEGEEAGKSFIRKLLGWKGYSNYSSLDLFPRFRQGLWKFLIF